MVERNAIPVQQFIDAHYTCCRFVDGGASTNATFKPGHTSIN